MLIVSKRTSWSGCLWRYCWTFCACHQLFLSSSSSSACCYLSDRWDQILCKQEVNLLADLQKRYFVLQSCLQTELTFIQKHWELQDLLPHLLLLLQQSPLCAILLLLEYIYCFSSYICSRVKNSKWHEECGCHVTFRGPSDLQHLTFTPQRFYSSTFNFFRVNRSVFWNDAAAVRPAGKSKK